MESHHLLSKAPSPPPSTHIAWQLRLWLDTGEVRVLAAGWSVVGLFVLRNQIQSKWQGYLESVLCEA